MAASEKVEEVVISAPVHCDGCARKLRQRLHGFGEVSVDSQNNTVVVRGAGAVQNAADAVDIVGRQTGNKATLLSPASLSPGKAAGAGMKKTGPAGTTEIAEVDTEMVTVLRINLHCDACCEEIKRRILKIQGVKEAAPLLKSSQVVVKGVVEPATLVGFVHRTTGRKAAIVRAEPMDLLLPPPTEAPAPQQMEEAGTIHVDDDPPSANSGGEMNKEAPPEEEDKRGGGEQHNNNADKKHQRTEKPSNDDQHGVDDGDAPTANGGDDDGFVIENRRKDDHKLVGAPLPPPAGVVTVVAPERVAAMHNFSDPRHTYPASYPYARMHEYYHYCPPQPYPYAYYSPAMYGYPYCYSPTDQAFSEDNPNTCAIV